MIEFMPRDWYNLKLRNYEYSKLDIWLINNCNFRLGKWSLFGWKTKLQCKLSKQHYPLIMRGTNPNDGYYARLFCSRCGIELDKIRYTGNVEK